MKLNRDYQTRDALIFNQQYNNYDIKYFKGLTHDTLAKLIELQFADPEDAQNAAPSIQEIYDFMKEHPSVTAHGYAVSIVRDDYRISIEGLECTLPEDEITKDLIRDFVEFCNGADELHTQPLLRSWWD